MVLLTGGARRRFVLLMLAAATSARAGIVEVAEASKSSVLAVGTYDPLGNPRFRFRGTAFVVADGNLAVTNAHVLPAPNDPDLTHRLVVVLPRSRDDGGLRTATIVATDAVHDLALLKLDGAPLSPLRLAGEGVAPDGREILLIGYPVGVVLGFVPITHRGIVSASVPVAQPLPSARQLDERTVSRMRQGSFDIYQLDATAYPGNSGSPLLDAQTGQVLGVINSVFVKGSRESALAQPTGITYAIPVRYLTELLGRR